MPTKRKAVKHSESHTQATQAAKLVEARKRAAILEEAAAVADAEAQGYDASPVVSDRLHAAACRRIAESIRGLK